MQSFKKHMLDKAAANYVSNEEVEQIDELSKTTLGNYIKKAANDKADTAFHRGYRAYSNSDHKPHSEPMRNKVAVGQENRNKGIKRAVNKLTREEVDQIEERIDVAKTGMGDVIKDFQKSDAPQFAGKSKEKRRQMAIAAKLNSEEEYMSEDNLIQEDLQIEITMEELDEIAEAYMGFDKVTKALAAKGAKNPKALAAWIGRNKYGKEKFQKAAAAGKKLGEEETVTKTLPSFKEMMMEYNADKSGRYVHKGSYGSSYDVGKDNDEQESGEKRGRGRPKKSASGARQKGSTTGKRKGGVEMTGYPLHLPNR